MSSSNLLIEPFQSQTNRADLMAAFHRVVALSGRRHVTDLHVRRLLDYVRAKDSDGSGIQRSLQQLADKLVLAVATCRRVIDRAAKHFGLLTVTHQHNVSGRQTINRYSINWPAVSEKCQPSVAAPSILAQTHPPHINSSNNESAPLRPSSSSAVKSSSSSCNLKPKVSNLTSHWDTLFAKLKAFIACSRRSGAKNLYHALILMRHKLERMRNRSAPWEAAPLIGLLPSAARTLRSPIRRLFPRPELLQPYRLPVRLAPCKFKCRCSPRTCPCFIR